MPSRIRRLSLSKFSKFCLKFFSSIKQACATAYTNTITCVIELGYMQSTIIGM